MQMSMTYEDKYFEGIMKLDKTMKNTSHHHSIVVIAILTLHCWESVASSRDDKGSIGPERIYAQGDLCIRDRLLNLQLRRYSPRLF